MRFGGVILATLALTAGCAKTSGEIYDPRANAGRQLDAAAARARDEGKRVLAVVGGNW